MMIEVLVEADFAGGVLVAFVQLWSNAGHLLPA